MTQDHEKDQNSASESASGKERVIKKYPNRRLYDTQTSSYITLTEIKDMVMSSQVFVVRDAKTSEDLTRSILLQIILEEEAAGTPMFTAPLLANIIRFYGHAMQGFMGGYLEKNIQAMQDMQAPMMQAALNNNADHSKNLFAQMQEQMQSQIQKQTELMFQAFGLKR
jgi:polyhydroxyalkanoate synthesis repressor PhaR